VISQLNKETSIYNKKADKASLQLLLQHNEITKFTDLKCELLTQIDKILKRLKSYYDKVLKREFESRHVPLEDDEGDEEEPLNFVKLITESNDKLIDMLNCEINAKKDEMTLLIKESDQLLDEKHKIIEIESENIKKIANNYQQLVDDYEKIEKDHSKVYYDLKSQTQLYEDRSFQLNDLEESIKRLQHLREINTASLDDIQLIINDKNDQLLQLEEAIVTKNQTNHSLQTSIQNLSIKLKKQQKMISENEQKMSEIVEIDSKLKDLKEQSSKEEIKLNKLKKENQSLSIELNGKQNDLDHYETIKYDLISTKKSIIDNEFKLKRQNQLLSDFNEKKYQFDELKKMEIELKLDLQQEQQRHSQYLDDNQKLSKKNDKLREALEEAQQK
jgi:hypothetical protein